jgi:hypothetical protein
MLNRANGRQELERVNMFIRALSDEMAHSQSNTNNGRANAVAIEMEQALYKLRLRKLLICALVGSDSVADKKIGH